MFLELIAHGARDGGSVLRAEWELRSLSIDADDAEDVVGALQALRELESVSVRGGPVPSWMAIEVPVDEGDAQHALGRAQALAWTVEQRLHRVGVHIAAEWRGVTRITRSTSRSRRRLGRRARAPLGVWGPAVVLALALVAAIGSWPLAATTASGVSGFGLAAFLLLACGGLWRSAQRSGTPYVLSAAATIAVVVLFGSLYALAAHDGNVLYDAPAVANATARAGIDRERVDTIGEAMYVAASVGAAPDLKLRDGAILIAHVQKILFLGLLGGAVAGTIVMTLRVLRTTLATDERLTAREDAGPEYPQG